MTLRENLCKAAGWKYCAEHDSPLWNGSRPCHGKHHVEVSHAYYCGHGLDTEEMCLRRVIAAGI